MPACKTHSNFTFSVPATRTAGPLLSVLMGLVAVAGCAVDLDPMKSPAPSHDPEFHTPEGCPFVYDFEQPDYQGINNLQFINREWILVVNEYWRAAKEEAERRAAETEEGKEWIARKGKINSWSWVKKWEPMVRKQFVEVYTQYKDTAEPDFFTLQSEDDTSYQQVRHPERVIPWHQQIGAYMKYHDARDYEVSTALLGCYSYLKWPTPLRPGCTYTLTQTDGRAVRFTWSEDLCVSRAIKVNQNGYSRSSEHKYAYLGLWVPTMGPFDFSTLEGQPFEVVPVGGGDPVLQGAIHLKAKNPTFLKVDRDTKEKSPAGAICGEDVYRLDLSGLDAEGDFYIRIPGVGRSWPFHHGDHAFGRAFYIAMRGMYQQRCGCVLDASLTAWPREACHTEAGESGMLPLTPYMRQSKTDLYVPEFTAIKNTGIAPPAAGHSGRGGWHDAADFDRRWWHYIAVWDLLFAYELAPESFSDNQLHLPESGNGIPDLLDEAAYGLLCWRNTQDEEGGISGRIEQTQHTPYTEFGMPDKDPFPMFNSLRTREFSLRYAAAAAQLARLMKPFDEQEAKGWLDSARRAYAYGMDPAHALNLTNYANTGKAVVETEDWNYRSRCLAGIEMYLATGNQAALKDGLEHFEYTRKTMQHPFKTRWHLLPYALHKDPLIPEEIRQRARNFYIDHANHLLTPLTEQPYPYSLPLDWPWGYAWGQGNMNNLGRELLVAYYLTGKTNQAYYTAAALNADFMLGCNPLGVSWMSGCGYNYPTVFFDAESEMDGIADPVPGITVYGPTGGLGMGARRHGYFLMDDFQSFKPEEGDIAFCPPPFDTLDGLGGIPTWRRWTPDFHTDPAMQEFTVWETMSSSCFSYGLLMGEGWTPSRDLLNLQPRPESALFGHFLTP